MSPEGEALLIGAIAGGIVTVLIPWWRNRKETRADAISEWRGIADRQRQDIDNQGTEIRSLTAQIFAMHEANARCMATNAELNGEIKLMQAAIQRLQGLAGDTAPATSAPGLIIADASGTILEYTPGLIPLLHWLPRDVRGKNVELFIPARYLEAHRKGLASIKAADAPPWTEKTINGHALTREGTEVAVAITLSAWKTAKGEWLISGEVKKRGATQLVIDGKE